MSQFTGFYPSVQVDAWGTGIVSQAGTTILVETIKAIGLDDALQRTMRPWKKPLAWHDPAKILFDQIVSLAAGGACLADVDRFRDQPGGLFGSVASASTITRLFAQLAADRDAAVAAINRARATV